jgi:RimJ/RimL family protein N-acetyltransferase
VTGRLRYEPVQPADLDAFHGLVQDEHVRRYMMDGNVFPREWSAQRIRESQALFERRGVGIWLAFERSTNELVGFCGFENASGRPEPHLVYAVFERFTGKGFATEMARASIARARTQPGFAEIVADVDEINAASVRVLEKLGFERIAVQSGAFGNLLLLRLAPPTDDDLDGMSREQLLAEVKKLRQGIRAHRDSTGQGLCWHHPALWGLLPEKTDPVPIVPDWPQFLQGCVMYRQSLDAQAPDAPRSNEPYKGSGDA